MTARPLLRRIHRLHAAVTLLVAGTLVALNLAGALEPAAALRLFLAVELPMLAIFLAVTAIRVRAALRDGEAADPLQRIVEEEPLLRPAVAELRMMSDLVRAILGRPHVPAGTRAFGYARGSWGFPAVMLVISAVELAVVHVIVPWPWLHWTLLALTAYGMLAIVAMTASRRARPHLLGEESLQLRWGGATVLEVPLSRLERVEHRVDHASAALRAEDGLVVLAQQRPANVRLTLSESVPSLALGAIGWRPPHMPTREVRLAVDDPEAFAAELRAAAPHVAP